MAANLSMSAAFNFSSGIGRSTGFINEFMPPGSVKRKLALWVGVPFLCAILLALIFDQIVMKVVTRHGDEFELPDYINQPLVQAELLLREKNLTYQISSEEYASDKEKGIILKQYPIAGSKVKEGRIIKFIVSQGTKMVPIPMVAGKSVRQATLDLETAGLTIGEVAWAVSDTIPEKVVVFSYPAVGVEVPLGSKVNLMVNRGRASDYTFMPRLVGMTLSDATKLLNDKGLKVGLVTYRTNENYLPDTVLEQSEPEGTELSLGTEVDLVVSET